MSFWLKTNDVSVVVVLDNGNRECECIFRAVHIIDIFPIKIVKNPC